jgi:hypothetical protein
MSKRVFFIYILLTLNFLTAQNSSVRTVYIPIERYRANYTQKDSLGIMVKGKDTLIHITSHLRRQIPLKDVNEKRKSSNGKSYFVPMTIYKKSYKKRDSIGYILKDSDTLVMVKKLNEIPKNRVLYEPRDPSFLDIYKTVAFRFKNEGDKDSETMKYWKEPIKVYFAQNIHKDVVRSLKTFMKELETHVDSLHIQQVRSLEESNYVIFNNESYQYDTRVNKKSSCDYYIEWNNTSQITRAALRFDLLKLPSLKLRKQKLKELFFGSLGRFIMSDSFVCESYFSNCHSDTKYLTSLDIEILKYHYSYGICKGTSIRDFEEQHKFAQEMIKKNNGVNNFYFQH